MSTVPFTPRAVSAVPTRTSPLDDTSIWPGAETYEATPSYEM